MLILTRRIGESIIIAGNIKITILDAKRYQVKIGIAAPDNLTIDREEIYLRKLDEAKAEELTEDFSADEAEEERERAAQRELNFDRNDGRG